MYSDEIKSCVIGADQVINVWESMNDGNPYFGVFYTNRKKYFQFNRDDMEAAKRFLHGSLSALEESGDNQMFFLNIYSDSRPSYTDGGSVASFAFRLNPYNKTASVGAAGGGEVFAKMLNDAHLAQLKMAEQIAELKYANQPLDIWDKIGGVLENPGAANAIVPLLQPIIAGLMGLMSKITGAPMQAAVPQYSAIPGIAGPNVEPDADMEVKLDAALDRLEKHGDLVEMMTLLADFADKNPFMFKTYFAGLKAQS